MSINIPLLRKAIEWVEEQAALPEVERQWYQGYYRASAAAIGRSCGTVMCVAGYIADLSGVQWKSEDSAFTTDGEFADDIAQKLLGLDCGQARRMFNGWNSAADVRCIAENIAGERL